MNSINDMVWLKSNLRKDVKKYFKEKYPTYTFTKLDVSETDVMVFVRVRFEDQFGHKWQLDRVFGRSMLRKSKIQPYEVIFERIRIGLDSNLKGRQQSWQ